MFYLILDTVITISSLYLQLSDISVSCSMATDYERIFLFRRHFRMTKIFHHLRYPVSKRAPRPFVGMLWLDTHMYIRIGDRGISQNTAWICTQPDFYFRECQSCVVEWLGNLSHQSDVIMVAIASQITSLTNVYSTVYSDADQRKYQSSASLAFVRGIHRWPVNSPHKWPVTRKMFPFDDVIMWILPQIAPRRLVI